MRELTAVEIESEATEGDMDCGREIAKREWATAETLEAKVQILAKLLRVIERGEVNEI